MFVPVGTLTCTFRVSAAPDLVPNRVHTEEVSRSRDRTRYRQQMAGLIVMPVSYPKPAAVDGRETGSAD